MFVQKLFATQTIFLSHFFHIGIGLIFVQYCMLFSPFKYTYEKK